MSTNRIFSDDPNDKVLDEIAHFFTNQLGIPTKVDTGTPLDTLQHTISYNLITGAVEVWNGTTSVVINQDVIAAIAASYSDSKDVITLNSAKSYSDTGDTTTLNTSKAYTDTQFATALGAAFGGSAIPTSNPAPTVDTFYLATQAGTYTNMGGVIVSANSFAVISYKSTGAVWSISQSSLDLSTYALSGGSIKTLQQVDNAKVETSYLIEQTKNLFNKDATTLTTPYLKTGTFKDGSNGAESVNAGFMVYGPIPLASGQSLTGSIDGVTGGNGRIRSVSLYNSSNAFIGGGTNTATTTYTMGTVPTATYAVICLFAPALSSNLQIERGTIATFFESYGDRVKNSLIKLVDSQVTTIGDKYYRKLVDKIKVTEATFIQQTANLFNKSAPSTGTPQLIPNTSRDGTNGTDASNSTYSVYGPIALTVGQSIISSIGGSASGGNTVLRTVATYNAAGTFIGGGTNTISNTFTMGAATGAYVYVTLYNTGIASGGLQIQYGTTATAYEGYGRYLIEDIVGFKNAAVTPVTTLNWTTEGDSITIQGLWQPMVISKLSLALTNIGIAGTKMSGTNSDSMWQDLRVNQIPLTTDILTTMAGANDWSQSKDLGDINSVDTNTFMGAYNVYLGKVFTRIPNAQMFIHGVTYAIHPPVGETGWISATKNALGLTTKDYANAARQIAEKWNIPYIPVDDLCWNDYNYTRYLQDDSSGTVFVHPNSTYGGPAIAREVINSMINRIR